MNREIVIEKDDNGQERINRINYEISALQALRDRLRCKEVWVKGADRYRNPDEDLPADFDEGWNFIKRGVLGNGNKLFYQKGSLHRYSQAN